MSTNTILGVTARRIDELPAAMGGAVKLARAGLGVNGFGVQVLDLLPGVETPRHDESATGQEELYLALRGSGAVIFGDDDDRVELDPDGLVAVGPSVERRIAAGADGLRVLCVGGTPGTAYEPPVWTEGL
jgi:uncharacterized cupin superfamily protein